MLSQKTIDIVKSTAPVLAVKGTEITTTFYKNLFNAHPELLNIFNHANQQKGRQQAALANTVYAAANYIDQLHVLLPAVKQIAHKHRSLVVKPEHYPIVGENLLKAIKEVLGDAATDEIIEAWGEAYGVIADVFISVEKEMYDEAEGAAGGWDAFKEFKVVKKEKESDVITSFYLQPVDGKQLPAFKSGQYITVRLSIPGEKYLLNRQYSLSNALGEDCFRISVKREQLEGAPEGKVSNYLHDHLNVGDVLEVTAPAGDFVFEAPEEKAVRFIAGGVGITPFMSMLNTLANEKTNKEISLLHATKNNIVQAFRDEIAQINEALPNFNTVSFYEELNGEANASSAIQEGRVTEEVLKELVNKGDAEYYVCGPVPFMKFVITTLYALGVPKEQVKFEFFGPAMNIEEAIA
ncbi:NO-inducible flavohemoprotein [Bacillus massiliigorillae]|uniref:NO-inducible flavohemoprotein n=1 Tax=Bacillus massiliigorillae TaxID=1243664 RepID=UPI0003A0EFD4|nr:NO-inducible flavohemoprotein [Bacillus massiliigorillae]